MEEQTIVHEFLVESHENLSRLDQELVELEKSPRDKSLLGSIFRTIHTIKGTSGFLSFALLEKTTHQAENLLSQLRDGNKELTTGLVSLILETVDATRKILASIEATGGEGSDRFEELIERLKAAAALDALPHKLAATTPHCPDTVNSEEEGRAHAVADTNIRVNVGLLDKLMDLVGELVLTRNQILQFNTEREDPTLNATAQRLDLITSELQENVMKTRMQPIETVWNVLPRVVRDLSVAMGKQIRVEMVGSSTELDRSIIEAIKDPLVHLIRNACDHGIETPGVRATAGKTAEGRLLLRAYHEGGQVNIEISDDGTGIDITKVRQRAVKQGLLRDEQVAKLSDREALNLIFLPGLSTAKTVTNVSGRGVGMDVVKSSVEKIGGIVDIFSRPSGGTTVKLKIPLTLAIIPGLVITSGGERFVIPQVSLLELVRLDGDSREKQIEHVHDTPVYRRRGSLLPIAYLNHVLGLKSPASTETVNMVVLQAEDRQFGLVVDSINDTQEIVVKPLGKQLKGLNVYAGATIMGDGRVALILDVLGIGQRSGVVTETGEASHATAAEVKPTAEIELQRVLLFRAGSFERLAIPLSLVARLEEFPQMSIERAGGSQVVQYRSRILPLVSLRTVLEAGMPASQDAPDPVQVIVLSDRGRSLGVIVDQIVDVVEEAVTVKQPSSRKGLLGSAVIGKHVADFVDLSQVIRSASDSWLQGDGSAQNRGVLVAEASAFSRSLIRGALDMAGYRVFEAGNVEEATRGLERQPVDIVIAAADLPLGGSSALLAAMREHPAWRTTPVLVLAGSAEEVRARSARLLDWQDCQMKFDREAMLESVSRLAAALARPESDLDGVPVLAGVGEGI